MTDSPGSSERFTVRGRHGREYPLDLGTLRKWASQGTITPSHQIFIHSSQEWTCAGAIPAISELFNYKWGRVNPTLICPHCHEKGHVRTAPVKRKAGISGGKVMGGLLTGGVSLLATGLSRKQQLTQACCGNCGSNWDF